MSNKHFNMFVFTFIKILYAYWHFQNNLIQPFHSESAINLCQIQNFWVRYEDAEKPLNFSKDTNFLRIQSFPNAPSDIPARQGILWRTHVSAANILKGLGQRREINQCSSSSWNKFPFFWPLLPPSPPNCPLSISIRGKLGGEEAAFEENFWKNLVHGTWKSGKKLEWGEEDASTRGEVEKNFQSILIWFGLVISVICQWEK